MNRPVASGLALVCRKAKGSRILLVRTAPGAAWVLPTAKSGESFDQLLQTIRSELFPNGELILIANLTRQTHTREGDVTFSFASTDAELPDYFESTRFADARWASFKEARHILRGDLQSILPAAHWVASKPLL